MCTTVLSLVSMALLGFGSFLTELIQKSTKYCGLLLYDSGASCNLT